MKVLAYNINNSINDLIDELLNNKNFKTVVVNNEEEFKLHAKQNPDICFLPTTPSGIRSIDYVKNKFATITLYGPKNKYYYEGLSKSSNVTGM